MSNLEEHMASRSEVYKLVTAAFPDPKIATAVASWLLANKNAIRRVLDRVDNSDRASGRG